MILEGQTGTDLPYVESSIDSFFVNVDGDFPQFSSDAAVAAAANDTHNVNDEPQRQMVGSRSSAFSGGTLTNFLIKPHRRFIKSFTASANSLASSFKISALFNQNVPHLSHPFGGLRSLRLRPLRHGQKSL